MRVAPRVLMLVVDNRGEAGLRYPQALWVARANTKLKTRPGLAMQKRGVDHILFYPNFFMLGLYDEYRQWRCFQCKGTGVAPGDGRTECGFCNHGIR